MLETTKSKSPRIFQGVQQSKEVSKSTKEKPRPSNFNDSIVASEERTTTCRRANTRIPNIRIPVRKGSFIASPKLEGSIASEKDLSPFKGINKKKFVEQDGKRWGSEGLQNTNILRENSLNRRISNDKELQDTSDVKRSIVAKVAAGSLQEERREFPAAGNTTSECSITMKSEKSAEPLEKAEWAECDTALAATENEEENGASAIHSHNIEEFYSSKNRCGKLNKRQQVYSKEDTSEEMACSFKQAHKHHQKPLLVEDYYHFHFAKSNGISINRICRKNKVSLGKNKVLSRLKPSSKVIHQLWESPKIPSLIYQKTSHSSADSDAQGSLALSNTNEAEKTTPKTLFVEQIRSPMRGTFSWSVLQWNEKSAITGTRESTVSQPTPATDSQSCYHEDFSLNSYEAIRFLGVQTHETLQGANSKDNAEEPVAHHQHQNQPIPTNYEHFTRRETFQNGEKHDLNISSKENKHTEAVEACASLLTGLSSNERRKRANKLLFEKELLFPLQSGPLASKESSYEGKPVNGSFLERSVSSEMKNAQKMLLNFDTMKEPFMHTFQKVIVAHMTVDSLEKLQVGEEDENSREANLSTIAYDGEDCDSNLGNEGLKKCSAFCSRKKAPLDEENECIPLGIAENGGNLKSIASGNSNYVETLNGENSSGKTPSSQGTLLKKQIYPLPPVKNIPEEGYYTNAAGKKHAKEDHAPVKGDNSQLTLSLYKEKDKCLKDSDKGSASTVISLACHAKQKQILPLPVDENERRQYTRNLPEAVGSILEGASDLTHLKDKERRFREEEKTVENDANSSKTSGRGEAPLWTSDSYEREERVAAIPALSNKKRNNGLKSFDSTHIERLKSCEDSNKPFLDYFHACSNSFAHSPSEFFHFHTQDIHNLLGEPVENKNSSAIENSSGKNRDFEQENAECAVTSRCSSSAVREARIDAADITENATSASKPEDAQSRRNHINISTLASWKASALFSPASSFRWNDAACLKPPPLIYNHCNGQGGSPGIGWVNSCFLPWERDNSEFFPFNAHNRGSHWMNFLAQNPSLIEPYIRETSAQRAACYSYPFCSPWARQNSLLSPQSSCSLGYGYHGGQLMGELRGCGYYDLLMRRPWLHQMVAQQCYPGIISHGTDLPLHGDSYCKDAMSRLWMLEALEKGREMPHTHSPLLVSSNNLCLGAFLNGDNGGNQVGGYSWPQHQPHMVQSACPHSSSCSTNQDLSSLVEDLRSSRNLRGSTRVELASIRPHEAGNYWENDTNITTSHASPSISNEDRKIENNSSKYQQNIDFYKVKTGGKKITSRHQSSRGSSKNPGKKPGSPTTPTSERSHESSVSHRQESLTEAEEEAAEGKGIKDVEREEGDGVDGEGVEGLELRTSSISTQEAARNRRNLQEDRLFRQKHRSEENGKKSQRTHNKEDEKKKTKREEIKSSAAYAATDRHKSELLYENTHKEEPQYQNNSFFKDGKTHKNRQQFDEGFENDTRISYENSNAFAQCRDSKKLPPHESHTQADFKQKMCAHASQDVESASYASSVREALGLAPNKATFIEGDTTGNAGWLRQRCRLREGRDSKFTASTPGGAYSYGETFEHMEGVIEPRGKPDSASSHHFSSLHTEGQFTEGKAPTCLPHICEYEGNEAEGNSLVRRSHAALGVCKERDLLTSGGIGDKQCRESYTSCSAENLISSYNEPGKAFSVGPEPSISENSTPSLQEKPMGVEKQASRMKRCRTEVIKEELLSSSHPEGSMVSTQPNSQESLFNQQERNTTCDFHHSSHSLGGSSCAREAHTVDQGSFNGYVGDLNSKDYARKVSNPPREEGIYTQWLGYDFDSVKGKDQRLPSSEDKASKLSVSGSREALKLLGVIQQQQDDEGNSFAGRFEAEIPSSTFGATSMPVYIHPEVSTESHADNGNVLHTKSLDSLRQRGIPCEKEAERLKEHTQGREGEALKSGEAEKVAPSLQHGWDKLDLQGNGLPYDARTFSFSLDDGGRRAMEARKRDSYPAQQPKQNLQAVREGGFPTAYRSLQAEAELQRQKTAGLVDGGRLLPTHHRQVGERVCEGGNQRVNTAPISAGCHTGVMQQPMKEVACTGYEDSYGEGFSWRSLEDMRRHTSFESSERANTWKFGEEGGGVYIQEGLERADQIAMEKGVDRLQTRLGGEVFSRTGEVACDPRKRFRGGHVTHVDDRSCRQNRVNSEQNASNLQRIGVSKGINQANHPNFFANATSSNESNRELPSTSSDRLSNDREKSVCLATTAPGAFRGGYVQPLILSKEENYLGPVEPSCWRNPSEDSIIERNFGSPPLCVEMPKSQSCTQQFEPEESNKVFPGGEERLLRSPEGTEFFVKSLYYREKPVGNEERGWRESHTQGGGNFHPGGSCRGQQGGYIYPPGSWGSQQEAGSLHPSNSWRPQEADLLAAGELEDNKLEVKHMNASHLAITQEPSYNTLHYLEQDKHLNFHGQAESQARNCLDDANQDMWGQNLKRSCETLSTCDSGCNPDHTHGKFGANQPPRVIPVAESCISYQNPPLDGRSTPLSLSVESLGNCADSSTGSRTSDQYGYHRGKPSAASSVLRHQAVPPGGEGYQESIHKQLSFGKVRGPRSYHEKCMNASLAAHTQSDLVSLEGQQERGSEVTRNHPQQLSPSLLCGGEQTHLQQPIYRGEQTHFEHPPQAPHEKQLKSTQDIIKSYQPSEGEVHLYYPIEGSQREEANGFFEDAQKEANSLKNIHFSQEYDAGRRHPLNPPHPVAGRSFYPCDAFNEHQHTIAVAEEECLEGSSRLGQSGKTYTQLQANWPWVQEPRNSESFAFCLRRPFNQHALHGDSIPLRNPYGEAHAQPLEDSGVLNYADYHPMSISVNHNSGLQEERNFFVRPFIDTSSRDDGFASHSNLPGDSMVSLKPVPVVSPALGGGSLDIHQYKGAWQWHSNGDERQLPHYTPESAPSMQLKYTQQRPGQQRETHIKAYQQAQQMQAHAQAHTQAHPQTHHPTQHLTPPPTRHRMHPQNPSLPASKEYSLIKEGGIIKQKYSLSPTKVKPSAYVQGSKPVTSDPEFPIESHMKKGLACRLEALLSLGEAGDKLKTALGISKHSQGSKEGSSTKYTNGAHDSSKPNRMLSLKNSINQEQLSHTHQYTPAEANTCGSPYPGTHENSHSGMHPIVYAGLHPSTSTDICTGRLLPSSNLIYVRNEGTDEYPAINSHTPAAGNMQSYWQSEDSALANSQREAASSYIADGSNAQDTHTQLKPIIGAENSLYKLPIGFFNGNMGSYEMAHTQPHEMAHTQPHEMAYTQPHEMAYTQPHEMAYTQPHEMGYTQPHEMAYTQPHEMGYTQPHEMAYTQPHEMAYTQPHEMAYTQPHNIAHTQPHNIAHTQPHEMAHTQPHNIAHTQPHNIAHTQPHNIAHTQPHNIAHTQPHNIAHTQPHNIAHTQPHEMAHTHTYAIQSAHKKPQILTHKVCESNLPYEEPQADSLYALEGKCSQDRQCTHIEEGVKQSNDHHIKTLDCSLQRQVKQQNHTQAEIEAADCSEGREVMINELPIWRTSNEPILSDFELSNSSIASHLDEHTPHKPTWYASNIAQMSSNTLEAKTASIGSYEYSQLNTKTSSLQYEESLKQTANKFPSITTPPIYRTSRLQHPAHTNPQLTNPLSTKTTPLQHLPSSPTPLSSDPPPIEIPPLQIDKIKEFKRARHKKMMAEVSRLNPSPPKKMTTSSNTHKMIGPPPCLVEGISRGIGSKVFRKRESSTVVIHTLPTQWNEETSPNTVGGGKKASSLQPLPKHSKDISASQAGRKTAMLKEEEEPHAHTKSKSSDQPAATAVSHAGRKPTAVREDQEPHIHTKPKAHDNLLAMDKKLLISSRARARRDKQYITLKPCLAAEIQREAFPEDSNASITLKALCPKSMDSSNFPHETIRTQRRSSGSQQQTLVISKRKPDVAVCKPGGGVEAGPLGVRENCLHLIPRVGDHEKSLLHQHGGPPPSTEASACCQPNSLAAFHWLRQNHQNHNALMDPKTGQLLSLKTSHNSAGEGVKQVGGAAVDFSKSKYLINTSSGGGKNADIAPHSLADRNPPRQQSRNRLLFDGDYKPVVNSTVAKLGVSSVKLTQRVRKTAKEAVKTVDLDAHNRRNLQCVVKRGV